MVVTVLKWGRLPLEDTARVLLNYHLQLALGHFERLADHYTMEAGKIR